MKKLILFISLFIFISCNSNESKVSKWTDEEKDIVFKECINYAYTIEQLGDLDKSNNYCYCTLQIITNKFQNKADAEAQIGKDPSLRSIFEGC